LQTQKKLLNILRDKIISKVIAVQPKKPILWNRRSLFSFTNKNIHEEFFQLKKTLISPLKKDQKRLQGFTWNSFGSFENPKGVTLNLY